MKEDRFFHAGAWPLTCICTVFENRSKNLILQYVKM